MVIRIPDGWRETRLEGGTDTAKHTHRDTVAPSESSRDPTGTTAGRPRAPQPHSGMRTPSTYLNLMPARGPDRPRAGPRAPVRRDET